MLPSMRWSDATAANPSQSFPASSFNRLGERTGRATVIKKSIPSTLIIKYQQQISTTAYNTQHRFWFHSFQSLLAGLFQPIMDHFQILNWIYNLQPSGDRHWIMIYGAGNDQRRVDYRHRNRSIEKTRASLLFWTWSGRFRVRRWGADVQTFESSRGR